MAIATRCQTPGAVFHIAIHPRTVTVSVDLPHDLDLDAELAEILEANLHNAAELVMAALSRQEGTGMSDIRDPSPSLLDEVPGSGGGDGSELCPGNCGCRLGTNDADRFECGCDEGCCDQ